MKLSIKPNPRSLETDADPVLAEYLDARKAKEEAERKFRLAEDELLGNMRALSDKTRTLTDGGKVYRATYVQTNQTKVDEEALQKKIGKIAYRKLCDLKINKRKIEEAMNNGDLPVEVIGPLVTEVPGKPYIRYSEGVESDDQSA